VTGGDESPYRVGALTPNVPQILPRFQFSSMKLVALQCTTIYCFKLFAYWHYSHRMRSRAYETVERPSVCPSVCPSHYSAAARRCCCRPADINRLLHGRHRRSAANVSGVTFSVHQNAPFQVNNSLFPVERYSPAPIPLTLSAKPFASLEFQSDLYTPLS